MTARLRTIHLIVERKQISHGFRSSAMSDRVFVDHVFTPNSSSSKMFKAYSLAMGFYSYDSNSTTKSTIIYRIMNIIIYPQHTHTQDQYPDSVVDLIEFLLLCLLPWIGFQKFQARISLQCPQRWQEGAYVLPGET